MYIFLTEGAFRRVKNIISNIFYFDTRTLSCCTPAFVDRMCVAQSLKNKLETNFF
jgi:hypothetical protein